MALRCGDLGAASLTNWLTNTLASGLNRPWPRLRGWRGGAVAAANTDSRTGPSAATPPRERLPVGKSSEALRCSPAAPLVAPLLAVPPKPLLVCIDISLLAPKPRGLSGLPCAAPLVLAVAATL